MKARPVTQSRLIGNGRKVQRNGAIVRLDGEPAVLRQQDDGIVGVAEARSAFRHDLQDRLDVGRRSRDHAQDRAGRRLLLQRFRHLAVARLHLLEQAHVLDARSPPGRRMSGPVRSRAG